MSVSARAAVEVLRRRYAERLPGEERRAREIRAVLPAVVECLVREFGVTRIVLFGSLARGVAHADSDIDLAVAGLAPSRYFRAMARASDVAGRDVDLVPLEEARPHVRAIIDAKGEVLHDGGGPPDAGAAGSRR